MNRTTGGRVKERAAPSSRRRSPETSPSSWGRAGTTRRWTSANSPTGRSCAGHWREGRRRPSLRPLSELQTSACEGLLASPGGSRRPRPLGGVLIPSKGVRREKACDFYRSGILPATNSVCVGRLLLLPADTFCLADSWSSRSPFICSSPLFLVLFFFYRTGISG